MKKISNLFILLVLTLFFLGNCKKTPETITNTIIKHDTTSITIHDTLWVHDTLLIENMLVDTATYFFIVRHAEKGNGNDPDLTIEGQARASELKRILANVPLDGVFSTNYKRTKQTVKPIADEHGLALQIYNTNKKLIQTVLEDTQFHKVLVAGHSNTAPDLVNRLIGKNTYNDLGDNEYDNLFMVAYYDENRADVFLLKYGE